MLTAKAAVVFEPRACAHEIESMPAAMEAAIRAARDGRKLKLNASECGLAPVGGGNAEIDKASAAQAGGVHRLQGVRSAAIAA